MATIGRASAVADFGRFHMKGWLGLARLALRAHPQPDRLPQPPRRHGAVGVGVFQLPAGDPADRRVRLTRNGLTRATRARRCRRTGARARGTARARGVGGALVSRGRISGCSRSSDRVSGLVTRRAVRHRRARLLAAFVWWGIRFCRRRGARRHAAPLAVRLVVTASIVYLWFLAAWGMNYRRVPLQEQLAYDSARLTTGPRGAIRPRRRRSGERAAAGGARPRRADAIARRRALRRCSAGWAIDNARGRRRRTDRCSSSTSARPRSTG